MDEQERLRGIYASMSDNELLRLAKSKGGLIEVAQQAVDAEMAKRGLVVEEESAAPVVEDVEDVARDAGLVELTTFQMAMDARTAAAALDEAGISVWMEPAMRRLEEGGPLVKTNWLTVFVEKTRQVEAQGVLRERMGLFPVLAADEVDEDAEDGEALGIVGNFDPADADIARKALTEAGIWFEAEDETEYSGVMISTRPEDVDRAIEVVEAAFGEE